MEAQSEERKYEKVSQHVRFYFEKINYWRIDFQLEKAASWFGVKKNW